MTFLRRHTNGGRHHRTISISDESVRSMTVPFRVLCPLPSCEASRLCMPYMARTAAAAAAVATVQACCATDRTL
jgi:hypothetical protein